jgi:hypothetical protein
MPQPIRRKPKPVLPLVVSPGQAQQMLNSGSSYFYEALLPQLDSYLEGRLRKVTVESIERLVAARLAKAGGRKGRHPRRAAT